MLILGACSRNANSRPEPVFEHLLGRQGQPRGAQVYAVHLSDWKGCSQDPPLPRPRVRVGSGGEGISCQGSLPTWSLPKVSSSFSSFLHPWLLHLGSFSFAVAKGFATLLLSSYYSITLGHAEVPGRIHNLSGPLHVWAGHSLADEIKLCTVWLKRGGWMLLHWFIQW